MPSRFTHEKLKVYQESIKFVTAISAITDSLPKNLPIRDQLDRASVSIPLNIAEGNGKFTSKDKCRFLDIARGSAMECAACLDILYAKGKITETTMECFKSNLDEIVSMLVGLIRSTSSQRPF